MEAVRPLLLFGAALFVLSVLVWQGFYPWKCIEVRAYSGACATSPTPCLPPV